MNKLKPLIRNYGSGVMEAGFLDKDGNFLREMSIIKEEDINIFLSKFNLTSVLIIKM